MKQSAANNTFLKNVKKNFNSKIYKMALHLVNKAGEQTARQYVQQYTREKLNY